MILIYWSVCDVEWWNYVQTVSFLWVLGKGRLSLLNFNYKTWLTCKCIICLTYYLSLRLLYNQLLLLAVTPITIHFISEHLIGVIYIQSPLKHIFIAKCFLEIYCPTADCNVPPISFMSLLLSCLSTYSTEYIAFLSSAVDIIGRSTYIHNAYVLSLKSTDGSSSE